MVECRVCPEGHMCTADTITICPEGTYSLRGSSFCTDCPAAYYNDEKGKFTCKTCPRGHGCTSTAAAPCSAGFFSLGFSDCQMCPDGYYTDDEGSLICKVCPANYFCTNSVATVCPAGTYSPKGSTSCTDCPSSYTCPGTTPEFCQEGTFSSDGKTNCAPCSEGTYNIGLGSFKCYNCPAGFKCDGANPPQICPEGTFSKASASACSDCPDGTYSNIKGAWSCLKCRKGYECSNKTRLQICQRGFYSKEGQMQCNACNENTYNDGIGFSECLNCPEGFVCNAGKICKVQNCLTCSETDISKCETCNQNFFRNENDVCISNCYSSCKNCYNAGAPVICDDCKDIYFPLSDNNTTCHTSSSLVPFHNFDELSGQFIQCALSSCNSCYDENNSLFDCEKCTQIYVPLTDNQSICHVSKATITGYFYDSTKLVFSKCPKYCNACKDSASCETCAEGYEFDSAKSVCLLTVCHEICSVCFDKTQQISDCKTCVEIYYPLEDDATICYSKNALVREYYFSENDSSFNKCKVNCTKCSENGDCLECERGFILNSTNGQCEQCLFGAHCESCWITTFSLWICFSILIYCF